jgi:tyrosyl-tRNA synthetase
LHVVGGYSQTDTTYRDFQWLTTNDATNPFGAYLGVVGNATPANRAIVIGTGQLGSTNAGNFVPIMALPEIIYEGIMTWPDTAIPLGLELLTSLPMDVVNEVARSLPLPNVNPMHLKEAFAYRLIFELQGAEEALTGRQLFDLVYRQKGSLPEDRITKVSLEGIHGSLPLSEIVYRSGLAQDASHGARLVEEGAVYVNGSVVRNDMTVNGEIRLQLGKRTIKNVRLVEVS